MISDSPAASSSEASEDGEETGPFSDDLDYIQAELRWVEARVARLGFERRLSNLKEEEQSGREPHPFLGEE